MAGWKNKLLNRVGRTTLVKFVLSSIPTYVMQDYLIPTDICEIDKMVRGFIWVISTSH